MKSGQYHSGKPLLRRHQQPPDPPSSCSCKTVLLCLSALILFSKFFLFPSRRSYPPLVLPPGCNLSQGEWVPDLEGPLYTNDTCFTIQEHQNCLKWGRPDRDFLRWKWKPAGCDLPRFDPVWFLSLVTGKSIVFIGDSLARNQMQSLMCLISSVERPQDLSDGKSENFKRMFFPRHRLTIAIYWSPFLINAHLIDNDGPNHTGLWNLFLDEVDPTWYAQLRRYDLVVIADGNWFTRPSLFFENRRLVGCHFCHRPNVTDLTLRYSHRAAFRTALAAINRLAASGQFTGTVFVRSFSPAHFEGGEWNSGGNCRRRRPYRANETHLQPLDQEFYDHQLEEFRAATAAGGGAKMRLLDTTAAMLLRPDGHPSRYGHSAHDAVAMYNDCVHWCLPGPVDTWNQLLFAMLAQESS
ncbi:protein trichome birefringence-like 19 [Zingiber officinale]|uniref:protein trichome birefringence-like 19 n=1 Tax=Zingiber officinale TaxID=94328 RepID=UPI001C4BD450|nr:protein trichome birefringence-like 19 [Zingiber officinale]